MKLLSLITRIVFGTFALRRPRDWVIKPLLLLVAINALSVYVENMLLHDVQKPTMIALVTHSLVAMPFVVLVFGIVTYLYRVQNQLTHIAMTDVMTGLPNRRAFLEQTKRAFVDGHNGFLILIDADHFKRINDTHGHAVGDACLVALADRLRAVMAPEDILGRIGGEEFAAYMRRSDKPRLISVGKRMTQTIRVPIDGPAGAVRMTVSIGATDTDPLEPVETAIQRADIALYHAKKSGRARMIVGPRVTVTQAA